MGVDISEILDYAFEVMEDHQGPDEVKELIKKIVRVFGLDEYIAYEWLEKQQDQEEQGGDSSENTM